MYVVVVVCVCIMKEFKELKSSSGYIIVDRELPPLLAELVVLGTSRKLSKTKKKIKFK